MNIWVDPSSIITLQIFDFKRWHNPYIERIFRFQTQDGKFNTINPIDDSFISKWIEKLFSKIKEESWTKLPRIISALIHGKIMLKASVLVSSLKLRSNESFDHLVIAGAVSNLRTVSQTNQSLVNNKYNFSYSIKLEIMIETRYIFNKCSYIYDVCTIDRMSMKMLINKCLLYEEVLKSSWPNQEENDSELWNVHYTIYSSCSSAHLTYHFSNFLNLFKKRKKN